MIEFERISSVLIHIKMRCDIVSFVFLDIRPHSLMKGEGNISPQISGSEGKPSKKTA
jgi:hypothetical protein